ncbi:MAG: transporter substrate-binding domain-containing protein [Pseudodesulfovibrio sp.]
MRVASILLLVVACVMLSAVANADTKILRYHTAEWNGLTNRDGTGLYHEIVQKIFESKGYTIEVEYYPFSRGLMNVSLGGADMSGAAAKDESAYITAIYPIWESRNSALFRIDHLSSWQGLDSLKANPKTSVATPGIDAIIGVDLYEVATRNQALNMVLEGRKKYYVDDYATLAKLKAGDKNVVGFEGWNPPSTVKAFDWNSYVIRDVLIAPAFMVFQDTSRGHELRDIFDAGFAALHRSGELLTIYEKWGLASKMPVALVID